VAEVMNVNRSPEPHRTVAWEPEPGDGHTDGYPVSGNMDDIVSRLWQYTPEAPNAPMETRLLLNDAANEIERLRASVNELVLWAEIGAQAIQDWDGYEKDISGDGIDRDAGLRLLDRIDAGEFGKVRRD
jgi:hypothetical protein